MSAYEVPLPSPPPDTHLRAPMSGLFTRAAGNISNPEDLSEAVDVESEYAARKKVDFHPFALNISDLPQLSTPDSEVPPSLKSLPASRDCQLSSRPILKQRYSLESTLGLDGQHETTSTVDNMESLLQHLANDDRSSSIDAYQTITNLIKMYDEPPEQEILQKKMEELQKYIRRDLVVLDTNAAALPSEERLSMGNLVMSALKVLVTMVWSPAYSPCLTDEFRQWTIERSIQVLKEHTASKATLLHYMHLLATQNFHTRIMAHANRVPRVLEVLQDLTDHISGKAVVAERLLVYQKLIDQGKSAMRSKARMWVKNLLTAMGHSFKEVRSNAISAGTKACIAFAGQTSIAPVVREALAGMNNERTLSSSIANRLERVLAAKDEANQIPQIWTIMLMLCNTGNQKLDTWPQLHEWLRLIQRCFNCSDSTVRVQAFMAWNRLYYVARPTEASERVVSMLAKPAMIQLDRTGNSQSGKGSRQAVISSYCMLLYYAFRPSAQHAQYTRMWNEFVVKVMTRSFLSKSSANCDLSCRVLAALFHSALSGSRVWNENRAHENALLDPSELPAIDCKWVRVKMSSVLSIVRLLVDYASFGPGEALSEQSYIAQAWRNLVRSLRESTSKEVMLTADTKAAFASILAFLRPTVDQHDLEHSAEDGRLSLLAKITITELGPSTVLQALETPAEWHNSILLEQLMCDLAESSDETEMRQLDRTKLLDRCFALLQEDIRRLAQPEASADTGKRTEVLQFTNNVLRRTPPTKALQCLVQVQNAATMLIEGLEPLCQPDSSTFGLIFAQRLLPHVSPSQYQLLDNLISAILRTNHRDVQEALLMVWRAIPVGQGQPSLGPQSLAAIAALPKRLTGQVVGYVHGTKSLSVFSTVLRLANSGCELPMNELYSPEVPPSVKTRSATNRRQNVKNKARHNDSQIEFVSVESSPPDYANFDSQLLTVRQKDVRVRQRMEPALTFADLRSSPSTGKKQAQPSASREAESKTQERPTTPTLLLEDDDQPPTPTPKARKTLLIRLQPDVPSSPPSVVNGEIAARPATTITSSPVKDPAEADDAIQLNELQENDFVLNNRTPPLATDSNQEVGSPTSQKQQMYSERCQSPELPVEAVVNLPNIGLATEGVGSAEADASTPASYSNEDDALAASQLTQNLMEDSQDSLAAAGVQETPRSTSKRKRDEAHSVESEKKKRRRSSATTNDDIDQEHSQQGAAGGEAGDTIVVNMDKVPSQPTSRRGRPSQRHSSKDAASLPATPLQASQKSPTTTPSSTSKGGRRSRTRRKTRSQANREESPVAQIPVAAEPTRAEPRGEMDEVTLGVIMAEVKELATTEPPSPESEVPETAEALVAHAAAPPDVPAAEVLLATESKHDLAEPASVPPNVAASALVKGQETTTHFDLARDLQGILEHLNTVDSSAFGEKFDLGTIHSLCFKIGLKAQELATRNTD